MFLKGYCFPIGKPASPNFCFCNAQRARGSYCVEHCDRFGRVQTTGMVRAWYTLEFKQAAVSLSGSANGLLRGQDVGSFGSDTA